MVIVLVASMAVLAATPFAPVDADANEAPGGPQVFRSITAGGRFSCGILPPGLVKCWGANPMGQLGQEDRRNRGDAAIEMGAALAPVDLGTGRTATSLSAGRNHVCAVLDDGSLKCWGNNDWGKLGDGRSFWMNRGDEPGEMGDAMPAVDLGTGRSAVAVSAGESSTCALLDDASVKCWGSGGILGQGDLMPRATAGDEVSPVSLGAGRTATAIATGYAHTCAILDDGSVKCWGVNSSGQLGLGDTAARGAGPGEMGDSLPVVSLGTGRTAVAISAAAASTCALLDDGSVKCWGGNSAGQLGLGDTAPRGDGPGEMGDVLPVVDLGPGRTGLAVSMGSVGVSTASTCVLLDDGSVKCWGDNGAGQLGLGDTVDRGDGPGELGGSLPPVDLGSGGSAIGVTAGGEHACAVVGMALKCWGDNGAGQLGLGDTADRGDGPGEMGDALPAVDLDSPATGLAGSVVTADAPSVVAGAWVAVLDAGDLSLVGSDVADENGAFTVVVPAGTYRVYALDPAANHAGAMVPGTVMVGSGQLTAVQPALDATKGAAAATITEEGSGTPLPGVWVLALSASLANTGAVELVAETGGAGKVVVSPLTVGDHYVAYVDPTGAHAPRFFPAASDLGSSTPVEVDAGAGTVADVALPARAPAGGGATITGVVTGAGGVVAGARVVALRASDYQMVRGAVVGGNGAYTLTVPKGSYKLAIFGPDGRHLMEWYDDQPSTGLGSAATVSPPATADASLTPTTGAIAGRAFPGAWVVAIGPTGIAGGAIAAANSDYRLAGLAPGTYRVTFVDTESGFQEFYDDSPSYDAATPVSVTAGATTGNIDV
ncbi:MAG: hypothetical protein H6518_07625 [Microthrixaceae bacterium]|nr:hypothetical protein [Microthrixaceae bacterium]